MKAVLLLCFVAAASAQYISTYQHPFFYSGAAHSYLPFNSNVQYHANSGGVQHTVYKNHKMMKREAEADPQYFNTLGYSSYYTSPYLSSSFYNYKPYYHSYSHLYKREAEADPQYFTNMGYSSYYTSPYLKSHYTPYVSSSYIKPSYYTYSHLHKREAEADPQYFTNMGYSSYFTSPYLKSHYTPYVSSSYIKPTYYTHSGIYKREAEADPQMFYNHHQAGLYHHTPYVYNPVSYFKPMTYQNDFITNKNYAAKGQYKAMTAGSIHIAKREAEADPAVIYKTFNTYPYTYSHLNYGSYLPHAYSSYYHY